MRRRYRKSDFPDRDLRGPDRPGPEPEEGAIEASPFDSGITPEPITTPAPDVSAPAGESERSEGDEGASIPDDILGSEDPVEAGGSGAPEDFGDPESLEEARPPRLLIVDRHGSFSTRLGAAIATLRPMPEVLRLNRPTQVVEIVEQESPAVIVVAPAEVTGAGLRRLAEVHRAHPRIVIILSDNGKPISLRQSALCGAEDILPNRPGKARFRATIGRALEVAEDLKAQDPVVTERVIIREAPAPRPGPAPALRKDLARVFTVASASGGCGKTFLSTNLAAYLARATGARVLLVDFDLQFGEVAVSLHLRPSRTIDELVEADDIASSLEDFLVDHRCGYRVLCAPKDPIAGDRVGPREATAILEAARGAFDYVVVDTPPSLNETCLAAFDQSQSLVIMATADLPSLKNLRVFLRTLEKLQLPADQVSVVINKAEADSGINLQELEALYRQGFAAVLPYAREVSRSLNAGLPVLEHDPSSDISRKLAHFGMKLAPPAAGVTLPWPLEGAQPRRGWFRRRPKGRKP